MLATQVLTYNVCRSLDDFQGGGAAGSAACFDASMDRGSLALSFEAEEPCVPEVYRLFAQKGRRARHRFYKTSLRKLGTVLGDLKRS
jgi:hypothetical protein